MHEEEPEVSELEKIALSFVRRIQDEFSLDDQNRIIEQVYLSLQHYRTQQVIGLVQEQQNINRAIQQLQDFNTVREKD